MLAGSGVDYRVSHGSLQAGAGVFCIAACCVCGVPTATAGNNGRECVTTMLILQGGEAVMMRSILEVVMLLALLGGLVFVQHMLAAEKAERQAGKAEAGDKGEPEAGSEREL